MRRRLYTSVAALVRKLRRRDECIGHWFEHPPGEVSVQLIDRRFGEKYRHLVERHGLSGSGRSLVFRKQKRRWTLVGEGGWMI